jgi:hypothetical protein
MVLKQNTTIDVDVDNQDIAFPALWTIPFTWDTTCE